MKSITDAPRANCQPSKLEVNTKKEPLGPAAALDFEVFPAAEEKKIPLLNLYLSVWT